jgi:hypothetical protein
MFSTAAPPGCFFLPARRPRAARAAVRYTGQDHFQSQENHMTLTEQEQARLAADRAEFNALDETSGMDLTTHPTQNRYHDPVTEAMFRGWRLGRDGVAANPNAELLASGLREIRAAAEAGNCRYILRLVQEMTIAGQQELSEPVAETLAEVGPGWAETMVDLRILRTLPPNVKLYAGPVPLLGNAEKEADYAALLAFAKFAFEQRPCDYGLDAGKMRQAMEVQYNPILHLLMPHWHARPGADKATVALPPATAPALAIDTPVFRKLLGEYSAACEGSRAEADEERWIAAHSALIAYLESMLDHSPDGQLVWIVNDDAGEHVMMCPRAPSADELAQASTKIGRTCTARAFVLFPAKAAAPSPGTAVH